METRTTIQQVTFRKPFAMPGVDGLQPAGTYAVRTEQEMLDTPVSLGWRATSVIIEIFREGAMEHVPIDAQDLREALARDGNGEPPRHTTPPDRRPRDLMRRGGRR